MTVVCPMCTRSKGGPRAPDLGKSKVVLTRSKQSDVTLKGKRQRANTFVRTRQCLQCRYKWKTVEVLYDPTLRKQSNGKVSNEGHIPKPAYA